MSSPYDLRVLRNRYQGLRTSFCQHITVESGRWESDETERNRREWSEMKRGLASDSRSM